MENTQPQPKPQPKEIRRDLIVCTRTLYEDGTSAVAVEFQKPHEATPLNDESMNFMLSFLKSFIANWEAEVFKIVKNDQR